MNSPQKLKPKIRYSQPKTFFNLLHLRPKFFALLATLKSRKKLEHTAQFPSKLPLRSTAKFDRSNKSGRWSWPTKNEIERKWKAAVGMNGSGGAQRAVQQRASHAKQKSLSLRLNMIPHLPLCTKFLSPICWPLYAPYVHRARGTMANPTLGPPLPRSYVTVRPVRLSVRPRTSCQKSFFLFCEWARDRGAR